jgi:amino acid transporter
VTGPTGPSGSAPEQSRLRRELSRVDTIFFLISAMVAVDTIGAIAIGGGQAFTWLLVLFLFFFVPSALASAELGAAIPEEGGPYVWVRTAFGRLAGATTSLLYWAGTPLWLGGSLTVVAIAVFERFYGHLGTGAYLFGTLFVGGATLGAVLPLRWGKWLPSSGAIGQMVLLAFFTGSVVAYGILHGVHGIALSDFAPSYGAFIAVVPVLLYSFVGIELPSTAAEEMVDPRRDIPVAIGRAGVGQILMYAIPILAVLGSGRDGTGLRRRLAGHDGRLSHGDRRRRPEVFLGRADRRHRPHRAVVPPDLPGVRRAPRPQA